jgi:hypothetical protein
LQSLLLLWPGCHEQSKNQLVEIHFNHGKEPAQYQNKATL